MTRRTAFQSLVAIICGVWAENQKQAAPTPKTTATGTLKFMDPSAVSLRIHLGWKDITVMRGDESVTIDQDELFRALKGDGK